MKSKLKFILPYWVVLFGALMGAAHAAPVIASVSDGAIVAASDESPDPAKPADCKKYPKDPRCGR